MNLFTELAQKVTHSMRKKLDVPADHVRPQDDVPDDRVLQYVVGDYQRMYRERQTLIDHIRALEHIYKDVQLGLYKCTLAHSSRNRMVANIRQLLYDMTKEHMEAQKRLRRNLEEQQPNN